MKATLIPFSRLLQILTHDDEIELRNAWKSDQQREEKVKDKLFTGDEKEEEEHQGQNCFQSCMTRFFSSEGNLLSAIHNSAIKTQTMISKSHMKKAESKLVTSVKEKVRRTFPFIIVLVLPDSIRWPYLLLTRVAQYCSSQ
jgi:hypothetical protein